MSAERRLNSYIVAITVAIISVFLTWFIPRFSTDWTEKAADVVVAILTGTGLREFLIFLVERGLGNFERLRRHLLGNSYVEGKWTGYYSEKTGKRLVIVFIRQDWSDLFFNGRALLEDKTFYGQWDSITATVDGRTGRIRSVFSGDFVSGHYESTVSFHLEGEPPTTMCGQIIDNVSAANAERAWMVLERRDKNASDDECISHALKMIKNPPLVAN